MDIKYMDQFKRLSLDLVREIPIDRVNSFVTNAGEPLALYILDKRDIITKEILDPRGQRICYNFFTLAGYMAMDGSYKDQLAYFINLVNKDNNLNIPSCRSPKNWYINTNVFISNLRGEGFYKKHGHGKRGPEEYKKYMEAKE